MRTHNSKAPNTVAACISAQILSELHSDEGTPPMNAAKAMKPANQKIQVSTSTPSMAYGIAMAVA